MKKASLKLAAMVGLAAFAFGQNAHAQDVISIPASTGGLGPNPTTVTIPISITDNAGTLLNEDSAAGNKIRTVNVRINYTPTDAVTSASITVPAATVGNPCSNATGQSVFPGSGTGFVRTTVTWLTEATGPVFPLGTSAPCLALTLNFAASFPPAGVTLSIDTNPANTSLQSNDGTKTECVLGANCAGGGLTVSAAGTVTPVHLTKFSAE